MPQTNTTPNKSPFSWYTIEVRGKYFFLYLHNKNGLKKQECKSTEYSYIWKVLERRKALNKKIGEALEKAIHKLMADPDARARLQASTKRNTTQVLDTGKE